MKTRPGRGTIRFALSAVAFAMLAACGGGGGGGSGGGSPGSGTGTGGSPSATTTISGKAIDGYLGGATICFDNGQGACDNSLPTATTDGTGSYTLKVTADMTGKHLLAIVPAGTTDATSGKTFTSGFTLSAVVAGASQNVTPLTSMVVAQMAKGVSQSNAAAAVQQLAGVAPDSDYVAAGNSAALSLAQQTVQAVIQYAGGSIIGTQGVLNAIVDSGSPAALSTTPSILAAEEAALGTPANASQILASPLYSMEGYLGNGVIFGDAGYPDYSGYPIRNHYTLSGSTLTVSQEAWIATASSWITNPAGDVIDSDLNGDRTGSLISMSNASGGYLRKSDGTFTAYLSPDRLHSSYSLSNAGSTLTGTDANTGDTITLAYKSVDVSGQPLSSALSVSADYSAVRNAMTGTFPSGTTAYIGTLSHAHDQVLIPATGIDPPWINGADSTVGYQVQPDTDLAINVATLDGKVGSATSVQQAVGTQIDVSTTVQNRSCILLSLQANGVAQLIANPNQKPHADISVPVCGAPGVTLPVTGSWSISPTNANLMVITLPKAQVAALSTYSDIDDNVHRAILAGGNLAVALVNGSLLSGFDYPASVVQTDAQFPATVLNTIAASMVAAAKSMGLAE